MCTSSCILEATYYHMLDFYAHSAQLTGLYEYGLLKSKLAESAVKLEGHVDNDTITTFRLRCYDAYELLLSTCNRDVDMVKETIDSVAIPHKLERYFK